MKGYIFSLGEGTDVVEVLRGGLFGVWQPPPARGERGVPTWHTREWSDAMLATFADYLTISPGDRVFFFKDRLIYGIGEVVGSAEPLLNYPDSAEPHPPGPREKDALLSTGEWKRVRVVVPFSPSPAFFKEGIDMDEVLSSRGAGASWSLRFWEGVSFRQLGAKETRSLVEAFLRRFYGRPKDVIGPSKSRKELIQYIKSKNHGALSARRLVARNPGVYLDSDGVFESEKMLHAVLIERLREEEEGSDIFHEVPASPPKPPRWADSIDILVTRRYPGASIDSQAHFDLFEVKKNPETASSLGTLNKVVSQTMRYVDFVAENYADGNYGAIDAYYVARRYTERCKRAMRRWETELKDMITRPHVLRVGKDKLETRIWDKLKFLEYGWDDTKESLELSEVRFI